MKSKWIMCAVAALAASVCLGADFTCSDEGDGVVIVGKTSDHEQLAYVRLEVRPPNEDWLDMDLSQTELDVSVGQSLAEVSKGIVWVDSGSAATVAASGLPKGVVFDADTMSLKGVITKKGVHYVTFTAKNANGYTNARVLRLSVGGANDSFRNNAKIYGQGVIYSDWGCYSDDFPFDLPDLVVGEPIGTRRFDSWNYNIVKVKVAGVPPGLKAKVSGFKGYGGCLACGGGGGAITFTGTPTKAGAYTITISGTYKKKTYKTVRTIVVQGKHASLYFPVAVGADSLGRGTVTGGGVKAFGSTVKLAAKSSNAKKYFFGGWYVGADMENRLSEFISCNARAASASFIATAKRNATSGDCGGEIASFDYDGIEYVSQEGIFARFVTKAEDPITVSAPDGIWRVTTDNPLTLDVQSFSAYTLTVGKNALTTKSKKAKPAVSLVGNILKVTNKGRLKPGYHRFTVTAKNVAGNSHTIAFKAFVPNLTGGVRVDDDYYYSDDLLDLDTSDYGYTIQAGKAITLAELGIKTLNGAKLVSVTGLPPGMKWDAKKKRVTGLPTKPGVYTVVFSVKSRYSDCRGKYPTYKASATFNVNPLPECAVGTFSGYTTVGDGNLSAGSRLVAVTATSGGKITAKVGALTFSKTGWDEVGGQWWAAATLTATRTVGKGKTAKTYTDVLDIETFDVGWKEDGMTGTIKTYLNGEVVNADTEFAARKNVFASNEDAKAVAIAVAGTRKFGLYNAEAESGYSYDLVLGGTALTVSTKSNGAATLAGKIGSTKVSGTAMLECGDSLATVRFFSGQFIIEVTYTLEDGAVVSASGRVWKK